MAVFVLLLASCAGPVLTVTQRLSAPIRSVSLELDRTDLYFVPTSSQAQLLMAVSTGLYREGITVVPRGQGGAPVLIGRIEMFKPGLERHRNEYGVMNVDRGDFSARWRLEDASGVTLGECRTTGSTSMGPEVVEWGDLLQGVGANLAEFLLTE